MKNKSINQKDYWNDMARFGADASVIDCNDTKGYKNKYIADLRDNVILKKLKPTRSTSVLDFGCGSGNLSETLVHHGYKVSGLDISKKLLEFAKQRQNKIHWDIYHYDGKYIPLSDESIDTTVTHLVLNHIVDDINLNNTLNEIYRVLKPGGQLVVMEQIWRNTSISYDGSKKQRNIKNFLTVFNKTKFQLEDYNIVRRGHFPLIYAIRYGILPKSSYPAIAKIEYLIGRIFKQPFFDYADVVFSLKKS